MGKCTRPWGQPDRSRGLRSPNQGMNASGGQVLENGRRVRRRRVTPNVRADDHGGSWTRSTRIARMSVFVAIRVIRVPNCLCRGRRPSVAVADERLRWNVDRFAWAHRPLAAHGDRLRQSRMPGPTSAISATVDPLLSSPAPGAYFREPGVDIRGDVSVHAFWPRTLVTHHRVAAVQQQQPRNRPKTATWPLRALRARLTRCRCFGLWWTR